MPKISFYGNSETPSRLLQIFAKMTPGGKGVWKNLQGVDSLADSDYVVIIDRIQKLHIDLIPPEKQILIGAHPESCNGYARMTDIDAFYKMDIGETFGFGEWWINYDYDYLTRLPAGYKPNRLAVIMSNSNTQIYHRKRKEYLERFCGKYKDYVDVYGRIRPWGSIIPCYKGVLGQSEHAGSGYWYGKEPVYEQYEYALEFDAWGKHYFSERVFDCLLLWCMPFYNGGHGISKYLPNGCFKWVDMGLYGDDVIEWLKDRELYEKALPSIAEARDLLLNKYQLWARVSELAFGE